MNPLKAPGIIYSLASKRLKNIFGIARTNVNGVDDDLKVCSTLFYHTTLSHV